MKSSFSLIIFLSIIMWVVLLIIGKSVFYDFSNYKYLSSTWINGRFFSLYLEKWVQDSAWVILDSTEIRDSKSVKIIKKPLIWYEYPMLSLNWSDWCNIDNPSITILYDRYLLFERGWFYHSLYDINESKILLNYLDIKFEYEKKVNKTNIGCSEEYIDWKIENIHNKIVDIVEWE